MKRRDELLAKLMEECGELTQAAAKKQRYPKKYIHDGRIVSEKLEHEMGDVIAFIIMTRNELGLDNKNITKRVQQKLEKWRNKHRQQQKVVDIRKRV